MAHTFNALDFTGKDLPIWIVSGIGKGTVVGHAIISQSSLRRAPLLDPHYIPAPIPDRAWVEPYWTGSKWVEKAAAISTKRKIVKWARKTYRKAKALVAKIKSYLQKGHTNASI
jgi:hypothetical protein